MRGPELDKQAVDVLPFRINRFTDSLREDVRRADVDTFNTLRFDGLECHGDPLDTGRSPLKVMYLSFVTLEKSSWGVFVPTTAIDSEVLAGHRS